MKNVSFVPFLISIDQFKVILDEVISLSSLDLVYSNDVLLILYFIYLGMFLFCVVTFIRFVYKFIVIFLDKVI